MFECNNNFEAYPQLLFSGPGGTQITMPEMCMVPGTIMRDSGSASLPNRLHPQNPQGLSFALGGTVLETPQPSLSALFYLGFRDFEHFNTVDLLEFVRAHSSTLNFPQTLMLMLTHVDRMKVKQGLRSDQMSITWSDDGHSFAILDRKRFIKKLLPLFFREAKFSSFTRKLYRWGFRQIFLPKTNKKNKQKQQQRHLIFGHALFQRDDKSLMANMKSVTAAGTRRAIAALNLRKQLRGEQKESGSKDGDDDDSSSCSSKDEIVANKRKGKEDDDNDAASVIYDYASVRESGDSENQSSGQAYSGLTNLALSASGIGVSAPLPSQTMNSVPFLPGPTVAAPPMLPMNYATPMMMPDAYRYVPSPMMQGVSPMLYAPMTGAFFPLGASSSLMYPQGFTPAHGLSLCYPNRPYVINVLPTSEVGAFPVTNFGYNLPAALPESVSSSVVPQAVTSMDAAALPVPAVVTSSGFQMSAPLNLSDDAAAMGARTG